MMYFRNYIFQVTDLLALPSSLKVNIVEDEFTESSSTRFVDNEDFSLLKTLIMARFLCLFT